MRTKLVWVMIVCVGLLLAASVGFAQQGAQVPAVVKLAASVSAITVAEVEAGATITLSWHIVNVQAGQRVALDYAVQNGWVTILNQGETLAPVGSREVALRDPLNFGPPTFRLTLLNGRNIVDQRYLIIPYAAPDAPTTVDQLSADVVSIDRAFLNQREPRITLSWQVSNRTPETNLVFEQIVGADQTQTVELPRQFLYVPSLGSGPVQLVPTDESSVRVRLSVVNVIDGSVVASRELTIPFTGEGPLPTPDAALPTSVSLPSAQETPQGLPPAPSQETPQILPTADASASGGASTSAPTINAFTINPLSTAPGTNVTIAWNVAGATTVQIQEIVAGSAQPGITYVQLPLLGAVSVPLPADATSSVTYRLTAIDDAGQIAQSEVIVSVANAAG